jgi:gamma-glutamyltranspeptidase/glutathione hydrolase
MRTTSVAFLLWISVAAAHAGDRNTPTPYRAGRSVTYATHGMVATSHPLAVQIGLDVLKRGGNAIDAAIATNAAMGLVEPMSCGIGGDLYAIIWDAKSQKLYGLNASGRSPYAASIDAMLARISGRDKARDMGQIPQIPLFGPLPWSVPGCVDGWETMRQRFGSMPLAELLAPSIRYAEDGFPVTEVISGYWQKAADRMKHYPESARTYLPEGHAPNAGDIFKNPDLAVSYRQIAQGGCDAFYRGPIAQAIVQFSEKCGGLFSLRDFAEHQSTWVEPVSTNYRGRDVWELPPPGQGIAALQMLNILAGYDLSKMRPPSADFWHLFLEAKKLVYADRARYYADPDFVHVPVAQLLSHAYADSRRRLIRMDRAQTRIEAGDTRLSRGDTIYLCVVDKDRNCVSLIQSNYYGFGSAMVPDKLGFALQNRGNLFALDRHHANRLEPHKRPFHTIIPAFVTQQGKPWLVFGVMGGDMQPQGHVEVLCNLIDFGMNLQEAGEAPRLEHTGSATPTGLAGAANGGRVLAEPGISAEVLADLSRRGHKIEHTKTNGGGYQAIMIDPKTNVLSGASEARKDGCALGY